MGVIWVGLVVFFIGENIEVVFREFMREVFRRDGRDSEEFLCR